MSNFKKLHDFEVFDFIRNLNDDLTCLLEHDVAKYSRQLNKIKW